MASAGRVLLLFKGDYDNAVQYQKMDAVAYQGSTYVCKQTSTGNVPTDTTYWQILARGATDALGLAYDNTESGLDAQNVQDAIDELSSDLKGSYQFRSTRSIVLATADGTKTVSQLLAEAKTALQALTPQYTHCKILFFQIPTGNNTAAITLFLFESAVDLFSDFSSKNIVGYGIRGESNSTTTYYVSTAGTENVIVNSLIRSSGNTVTDITSRVPSNGSKLSVQIEDYERIS